MKKPKLKNYLGTLDSIAQTPSTLLEHKTLVETPSFEQTPYLHTLCSEGVKNPCTFAIECM